MFYSLRGNLIHTEPGIAVVECGGVGFKCMVTASTLRTLPSVGGEVTLYTHLNVREDALELFGFATSAELYCFRLLTGVTGIGAKLGVSILSELSAEQVAMAVAEEDVKSLTRAPGVGAKVAQRIILELRDKFKSGVEVRTQSEAFRSGGFNIAKGDNFSAAINALAVLGYSPAEVSGILTTLDSSLPVEHLIRLTLRALAAGGRDR